MRGVCGRAVGLSPKQVEPTDDSARVKVNVKQVYVRVKDWIGDVHLLTYHHYKNSARY